MTRPAVNATVPANTIPFPLKIRALQEGWKILFFKSGFEKDASKSDEWNPLLGAGGPNCRKTQ